MAAWLALTAPVRAAAAEPEHVPCLVCGEYFPQATDDPLCPDCDHAEENDAADFYGACGVRGCQRCYPRFDLDNNELPDPCPGLTES